MKVVCNWLNTASVIDYWECRGWRFQTQKWVGRDRIELTFGH